MNDTRYIVIITIGLLLVLFASFFIALLNIRHRQKTYALLQKQKEETELQKQKLEQAMDELEATQNDDNFKKDGPSCHTKKK